MLRRRQGILILHESSKLSALVSTKYPPHGGVIAGHVKQYFRQRLNGICFFPVLLFFLHLSVIRKIEDSSEIVLERDTIIYPHRAKRRSLKTILTACGR